VRHHRQGGGGLGLLEGLRRLEYRSYDSAGIATLVDGHIECRRAEGVAGIKDIDVDQPRNLAKSVTVE
jgi:glucosamine 6-phosphate synthetase-like amidotransferase/phosphosugar isomerase protein